MHRALARDGGDQFAGKVFLPFEGNRALAAILSKAFLLAEDKDKRPDHRAPDPGLESRSYQGIKEETFQKTYR